MPGDDREALAARSANPGGLEGCYVPGLQATDYRVFHAAKLIPANSDIVFQVHYTTVGTAMTDILKPVERALVIDPATA